MLKMIRSFALAAALVAAAGPALAQSYAKTSRPWFSQGRIAAAVAVTTSSAATALPAAGLIAVICNVGANDAYLNFGTSNAVAATVAGGSWLKAATCASYDLQPFGATTYTFFAAIVASGSASLYVETGIGTPPGLSASGSGSSTSNPVIVSSIPASIASAIVPNNTTAVNIAGATLKILQSVECYNNSATIAYVKVYDALSATAGSGTPAARYLCPASTSGNGAIAIYPTGRQFTTGITYIVTTGIADTDVAAPAASTYIVNIGYK